MILDQSVYVPMSIYLVLFLRYSTSNNDVHLKQSESELLKLAESGTSRYSTDRVALSVCRPVSLPL